MHTPTTPYGRAAARQTSHAPIFRIVPEPESNGKYNGEFVVGNRLESYRLALRHILGACFRCQSEKRASHFAILMTVGKVMEKKLWQSFGGSDWVLLLKAAKEKYNPSSQFKNDQQPL
eukprot:scaffold140306_cov53-Attheya_sp.AAC.2